MTQTNPARKLDAKAKVALKADPRWPGLISSIHAVWQYVGSDCEQGCAEEGIRCTSAMRMETCLDAGRMSSHVKNGGEEADKFVSEMIADFGYNAVEKFLIKETGL